VPFPKDAAVTLRNFAGAVSKYQSFGHFDQCLCASPGPHLRHVVRSKNVPTIQPEGESFVKVICLSIIPALSLGLAFQASAQQTAASTVAADSKYCSTLARTYQSMHPVTQPMPASDAVLLTTCDADPRGTIVALQKRFANKHLDVPQDPALANRVGR
jgi:hypothetical protein